MKNLYKINDELYIISNTENVNENCWNITDDKLVQVSYLLSDEVAKGNKIILTTNKLLIKDGIQAIDDEFLQWFVKNPSCENVEVEKWTDYKLEDGNEIPFFNYKIIIPKEIDILDMGQIIPKEQILIQSSIDGEDIWGYKQDENCVFTRNTNVLQQSDLCVKCGREMWKHKTPLV